MQKSRRGIGHIEADEPGAASFRVCEARLIPGLEATVGFLSSSYANYRVSVAGDGVRYYIAMGYWSGDNNPELFILRGLALLSHTGSNRRELATVLLDSTPVERRHVELFIQQNVTFTPPEKRVFLD